MKYILEEWRTKKDIAHYQAMIKEVKNMMHEEHKCTIPSEPRLLRYQAEIEQLRDKIQSEYARLRILRERGMI